MSDLPDLPNTSAPNFLQRVRESLQVLLGNTNNTDSQAVTVKDLVDAGIAGRAVGFVPGPTGSLPLIVPGADLYEPAYVEDLSVPPTPTGLAATAGLTTLFIQHDDPAFTVGHGYLRTVVYGAKYSGTGPLPTYTEGVTPILTEFVGKVGTYGTDPNQEWHIWAKWMSVDGVLSAVAGGTNGISSTSTKVQTTQIQALAVTDALIANLAAGKLTAGSISSGEYVQSTGYVAGSVGWRINGAGSAEFSSVTVRGTVVASAGTIGAAVIGANFVNSTNWITGSTGWRFNSDGSAEFNNVNVRGILNGGAMTGYAWPAAGTYGYHLSTSGLLIGNANNGTYFQVDGVGNIYSPSFSIVSGNLTLSGGTVQNGSGTFVMNMNASGSALLLRAGTLTSYGYLGTHYPVEIYANGSAFFGRGAVGGGQLLASSVSAAYAIPTAEKPAVVFQAAPVDQAAGGA